MVQYQDNPTEAFVRNDLVKIVSNGKTIEGIVMKQDHQWLFTNYGVYNLAHPDVKAFREKHN